jgi:hypothetical protein
MLSSVFGIVSAGPQQERFAVGSVTVDSSGVVLRLGRQRLDAALLLLHSWNDDTDDI